MKVTIFIFSSLLLLTACGKNESGKNASASPYVSTYSVQEEEALRTSFINDGKALLLRYEEKLKDMFGLRTVALIRNRLKRENVQFSERLLYNDRNEYARSTNRDYLVTLYVGQEQPKLSWRGYKLQDKNYVRLIMHELLLLGEIADHNYYYTERVLRPVIRR